MFKLQFKKYDYNPLTSENIQDDDENHLATNIEADNLESYWLKKFMIFVFLLTLITYSFFSYTKIIDEEANTVINNSFNDVILTVDNGQVKPFQHTLQKAKYYLNTSQCRVPYVDPFTPEVLKKFKRFNNTGCGKKKQLIKLWFNTNIKQYVLHIDTNVLNEYAALKNISKPTGTVQCCYREIIRIGQTSEADNKFKLLPCTNFDQNFTVPTHINSLIIECKWCKKCAKFHQSAFYLVQVKNRTINTEQNTSSSSTSLSSILSSSSFSTQKASVLLIGIDTLSRINIRRTMPKTVDYLVKQNWFELLGYNKVGDNTFPNLMALLTGKNSSTAYGICKPKTPGALDKCNFIWKQFKSQGYHTAYAEDSVNLSTFNYLKAGFLQPPTDYYFRPTALALEHSLQSFKKYGLKYCIGNRQYSEYIYDFAIQFALRFRDEPHFGLFWTNSFSHNNFALSSSMDTKMLQYFKQLESQGTLENSIVMFFSDHGSRFGVLVDMPEGFLESRLPMFFISLPTWFRNKYPRYVKHLMINTGRLTTPYDVYMTFQHILKLNDPKYVITVASGCPKCQSLFEEIPENRTCEYANITEKWCTCKPFKIVPRTNSKIIKIAKYTIAIMNKFIKKNNLTSKCSQLSLNKVTMSKQRYETDDSNNSIYVIDFVVNPHVHPWATFSATISHDEKKDLLNVTLDDILRTSQYESTAKCVQKIEEKKFCLCK